MYARFNEAFDASLRASFDEPFGVVARGDDIGARFSFVHMTRSFYEDFAASLRAERIDEARISQMCVDTILYTRDCQDASDGQDVDPQFYVFMHTAANFYEAFAASARDRGMDELNTCNMWFDFIEATESRLNAGTAP